MLRQSRRSARHRRRTNASVRRRFRDAGHIPAPIEAWIEDEGRNLKTVFSGDIGQPMRPVVRDPTPIAAADVLLVESTYGNRLHKSLPDTMAELEHAITDTLARKGGNVIVPAFAVGRTQELLYLLAEMHRAGRLPGMDIYVDSPMALKATEITLRHTRILDREAADLLAARRRRGARASASWKTWRVDRAAAVKVFHHHLGERHATPGVSSIICDNLGRECTILSPVSRPRHARPYRRRRAGGAHSASRCRCARHLLSGLSPSDQAALAWLAHFTTRRTRRRPWRARHGGNSRRRCATGCTGRTGQPAAHACVTLNQLKQWRPM
jgi:hypothetical protein